MNKLNDLICVNCDLPCTARWSPFPSRGPETEWRFASDCCNAPVTDDAGNAVVEPPDDRFANDDLPPFFDCNDVGID